MKSNIQSTYWTKVLTIQVNSSLLLIRYEKIVHEVTHELVSNSEAYSQS
jgi:hypothetical protein